MPRFASAKLKISIATLGFCTAIGAGASSAAEPDKSRPVCAKPAWPKEALRKGQTGIVSLAFLIGTDGTVVEAQLRKSSGFPLLDEAALEGISRCKFNPATVGGMPVEGWQRMQYVWTMDDTPKPTIHLKEADQHRDQALAGDPDAIFSLAQSYSKDLPNEGAYGQSILNALKLGPAAAQLELGNRFLSGIGAPLNRDEAMIWYVQSAEAGYAEAQLI